MNPIDRIVNDINDIFGASGDARMRVLEEERNAAVLEAERARKERDCAMAREKVAVRATAEAKSMLANLEFSAQEADREAAERESGLLGELAEVKDALAMVREALEAVTEAHRLVCLALTYEKDSHAVTRAMLKLASGALEALQGKQ